MPRFVPRQARRLRWKSERRTASRRTARALASSPSTWPVAIVSPGPQGVRLPQAHGVEAERLGHAVHLHLGREDGLRRAEAAEGAVGRRVRHHDAAVDADVLAAVGPGRVEAAPREHDRAQRAVGAAVEEDVDLHRGDAAVARDAGAVADDRGVALGGGGHVLEAVVDELDRPARLQREERGVAGDDRGVVLLARRSRRPSPSGRRAPSRGGAPRSATSALWT